MYEHFSFANESSTKVFTDMNKALEEAATLVVNPITATVGDIEVTPEGSIDFGNGDAKTTKHGFESFCKILGIPPKFARAIPADLLLHNIKRLSKDNAGIEITLLERDDGTFASIVKSPYKEIPYADVLSRFIDRNSIKKVEISEELMKIVFRFEQLKVPGLDDAKDTLYISDYILSSLIKETSLHAVAGLYKTQCENSFITPLLGKVRADYMKESEKRLEKFAQAFECYDNDLVATVFRNLSNNVNKYMRLPEFKYVWNHCSKLIGDADTDMLFEIDEDRRKVLLAEANEYISNAKKAKALGQLVPPPDTIPFEQYDIANKVTLIAQERLAGIDLVKAETLGGMILQWMIFLN